MQLVKKIGRVELYRKESFNGRCTALVEWFVGFDGKLLFSYAKKRDAVKLFETYAATEN